MNILFIAHENKLNGANKSMINLIDSLSEKHKFFVWCPYTDGPLIEALKNRNVEYISKYYFAWCTYFKHQPRSIMHLLWRRAKWTFREQFYNKRVVREMLSYVKKNRIDIIHMNSSIINIGAELKKECNVPLLWHFREFGKEDFGWDTLTTKHHFCKFVKNNADVVVTVSRAVAKKYQPYLKKNQIMVVYNGVDASNRNLKQTYNIDQTQKLVLLQAGVLCSQKGQQIAIKAMQILKEQGIDNIELLLAGSGQVPGNYSASELERLNVVLLGQVDNMAELRKKVDVELVCSKSEAFGRVTVEAMMSGIPVIGSNSGGTAELIQNGKNGLLFPSGNAVELAKQIEYFYYNRKQIEIMGRYAYEYAKDYFLISRCASEIDDIYKILIQNKRV